MNKIQCIAGTQTLDSVTVRETRERGWVMWGQGTEKGWHLSLIPLYLKKKKVTINALKQSADKKFG